MKQFPIPQFTAQNLRGINFVQRAGGPTMAYGGLKKKKVENQEI